MIEFVKKCSFNNVNVWLAPIKTTIWGLNYQKGQLSGTFCNKDQKCENGPNLPLGSLEVFIGEESSSKFEMYN